MCACLPRAVGALSPRSCDQEDELKEVILDMSSAQLVPAVELNMLGFLAGYGEVPQGEVYEGAGIARVISGIPHPLFNGVFRAQLTADTADETIEETIDQFKSHRVPALWWTGPSTRPDDLGSYLKLHGLTYRGEGPGMAVDLYELDSDWLTPTGLTIEPVEDPERLRTWTHVAWVASGFPSKGRDRFAALEVGLGITPVRSRRRYIGYLEGTPVATSMLIFYAGVAGIFAVATLPEARRQGIGAAMTLTPLLAAREMGYRVGTLYASEMGLPVYRRLGFQTVCGIGTYLLNMPSEGEESDSDSEA